MYVRKILWLAVLVGLVGAGWSIAARWQTEARNRAVEITVDIAEVRALAGNERKTLGETLKRLKEAGVHSVAVTEETIGALEESRRVTVPPWPTRHETALVPQDLSVLQRIEDSVRMKTGTPVETNLSTRTLVIPMDYTQLRGIGIGLDPETVGEVQKAGLKVVGRISNSGAIRPDGIVWTLSELKKQEVQTVIFSGDQVLGYKGYYLPDPAKPRDDTTVSVLADNKMQVGIIEFGKQKGDAELAKAAQDRAVRVHTVTGAEMFTATVPTNVQRFTLAARERNIRLLYVRLFLDEKDPLAFNAKYIEEIVDGLKRGNLEQASAHGYGDLTVPLWCRALMGIGLAGAFLLLVSSTTGLFTGGFSGGAANVVLAVSVLVALGLGVLCCLGYTGVKLAAFAAATVYPALALLYTDLLQPAPGHSPVGHALRMFLMVCAVTLTGAATVMGLLADRLFLIKADAFVGIKASQLVPLLLVALVYSLNLRGEKERPFDTALHQAGERLRTLATQPVLLWQVGGALVVLVILALLVLRSGNDPGVGVSALELRIRALLDSLLYARPRFKEFLIGHPALFLALVLAARGQHAWAVPVLLIGVIGQVSLLNTFCHLHTPILISLWRAFLGIAIGLVGGLMLLPLLPRPRTIPQTVTPAPAL